MEQHGTSPSYPRRALIKQTLRIGAVGYVGPIILGSATPASAAGVSPIPCSNPGCASACGSGSCVCLNAVEGGKNACVTTFCGDLCSSSAECPVGWLCILQLCCNNTNLTLNTGRASLHVCMPNCGVPIPEG